MVYFWKRTALIALVVCLVLGIVNASTILEVSMIREEYPGLQYFEIAEAAGSKRKTSAKFTELGFLNKIFRTILTLTLIAILGAAYTSFTQYAIGLITLATQIVVPLFLALLLLLAIKWGKIGAKCVRKTNFICCMALAAVPPLACAISKCAAHLAGVSHGVVVGDAIYFGFQFFLMALISGHYFYLSWKDKFLEGDAEKRRTFFAFTYLSVVLVSLPGLVWILRTPGVLSLGVLYGIGSTIAALVGYIGMDELIGELSKRDKRKGSKMRKALICLAFAVLIAAAVCCLASAPERILSALGGTLSHESLEKLLFTTTGHPETAPVFERTTPKYTLLDFDGAPYEDLEKADSVADNLSRTASVLPRALLGWG